MKTAECLERELEKDPSVTISLVSETNALLFTPMLAEVAGSSLEPSHISTPLRTTLHRTDFVRGRVTSVDLENRRVVLDANMGDNESCRSEVAYDHLVLALGAVSNYLGLSNVQKLAFDFKSLITQFASGTTLLRCSSGPTAKAIRRCAWRRQLSSLPGRLRRGRTGGRAQRFCPRAFSPTIPTCGARRCGLCWCMRVTASYWS